MALVSEMVTSGGVRVRVFDDLYRDASPEEIRRRRGRVYRALVEMIAEKEEQDRNRAAQQEGREEQATRGKEVNASEDARTHAKPARRQRRQGYQYQN